MARNPVPAKTANEILVENYKEVLEEVSDVFARKNNDYNSGVPIGTYFPFGDMSHAQMVHVKSQRIVSLIKSNVPIANEGIEDSAKDLINYCVFLILSKRGQL